MQEGGGSLFAQNGRSEFHRANSFFLTFLKIGDNFMRQNKDFAVFYVIHLEGGGVSSRKLGAASFIAQTRFEKLFKNRR